jgi:hypothetical protein
MVHRDSAAAVAESPEEVNLREPDIVLAISEPELPPFDLNTWQVRRSRVGVWATSDARRDDDRMKVLTFAR